MSKEAARTSHRAAQLYEPGPGSLSAPPGLGGTLRDGDGTASDFFLYFLTEKLSLGQVAG